MPHTGANPRRANGSRRDRSVAAVKARRDGCWICEAFGRDPTIDYSLPAGHPRCFECDELVPVSRGGSPYELDNLAAAHRRCNQWRGNRSVAEVLAIANRVRGAEQAKCATSKKWL